jgi:FkbM family methyltransferase
MDRFWHSYRRPGSLGAMETVEPRTCLAQLERLLAEPPAAARARGRRRWSATWAPGTPLVLHGAGDMGLRALGHLREQGIEPQAFADFAPEKQGTVLAGLPVLSPAQAAARWGARALFLVTVANRSHSYAATARAYATLGGCRTAPALEYFWAHPERCLPYYAMSPPETVLEGREEILEAFAALADPASRAHLLGYLRWRLHLDYAALPGPCPEPEYFPASLVSLAGPQCFVDCGAYDGDTLGQFLARTGGGLRSAHLFEPDPANFRRLEAQVRGLPREVAGRVALYPVAAGARCGRARFQSDGAESSALCATGNIEVPVAALDEVLGGAAPTFLKLDIEGAELDALQGASGLIRAHRPTVAVCVYHRPDHPWKIPLLLKRLLPGHRVALRPHAADGWDWVAYAAPGVPA